jgi:hypothetical protein
LVDVLQLIGRPRWSKRAEFPASEALGDRVFACGDGVYLRVNPRRGDGDPVYAVCWAESDYWARRAFSLPPFGGDVEPSAVPPSQWGPPPSLVRTGRPRSLTFRDLGDYEHSLPGAMTAILLNASYRLTDGAFLYCELKGQDGVTCIFASNKPTLADEPIAIEFRLPELV